MKVTIVYPKNFQIDLQIWPPPISSTNPNISSSIISIPTSTILNHLIKYQLLNQRTKQSNQDINNQILTTEPYSIVVYSTTKQSRNRDNNERMKKVMEVGGKGGEQRKYFIDDGDNRQLIEEIFGKLQEKEKQLSQCKNNKQELNNLNPKEQSQIPIIATNEKNQKQKMSKLNRKQKKDDANKKQGISSSPKLSYPKQNSDKNSKAQSTNTLNPQQDSPYSKPITGKRPLMRSRKSFQKLAQQHNKSIPDQQKQVNTQVQVPAQAQAQALAQNKNKKHLANQILLSKLATTNDQRIEYVNIVFELNGNVIHKYQVKRLKKLDTSLLAQYDIFYDQALKKRLAVHSITALRDVVYYCKPKDKLILQANLKKRKNSEVRQSDQYEDNEIMFEESKQYMNTMQIPTKQQQPHNSIFRIHKKKTTLNISSSNNPKQKHHNLESSPQLINTNILLQGSKSSIFKLSADSNIMKVFRVKKGKNVTKNMNGGIQDGQQQRYFRHRVVEEEEIQ